LLFYNLIPALLYYEFDDAGKGSDPYQGGWSALFETEFRAVVNFAG
jgi:hypothetical protein